MYESSVRGRSCGGVLACIGFLGVSFTIYIQDNHRFDLHKLTVQGSFLYNKIRIFVLALYRELYSDARDI